MPATWHPYELSFEAREPPDDPYGVDAVTATFEGGDGDRYTVPGFRDGATTFRVRFAPPAPGTWKWETTADDPGLRDSGSFEAAPADGEALHEHGFLHAGERALRHADGTPFFWLGDTAWSASTRATPGEWERYLDRRAEQGYNVVQVNALPQHDASKPHDRLPFADWAFGDPDHGYFRALDDLVGMAHDRGIVPALVALWFDYVPGANADWDYVYDERRELTERQAWTLGRYLGARYGAYGPAWLVSGDSEFAASYLPTYRAAAEGLRDACTHPLLTVHQPGGQVTPDIVNAEEWLDFHMYQSGHTDDLERPARQARESRALDPPRPVLNGEPAYEDMFSDRPDERLDRGLVRAAGWVSVLAGGNAGLTYGALGLWNWHREGDTFAAADRWGPPEPWDEALSLPAAGDYARLREIVTALDVAALEPRPGLVERDEPGIEAAVLPDAVLAYDTEGGPLTLRNPPAVESYEWVDPAGGDVVDATIARDGEAITARAPAFGGDALLLGRR